MVMINVALPNAAKADVHRRIRLPYCLGVAEISQELGIHTITYASGAQPSLIESGCLWLCGSSTGRSL